MNRKFALIGMLILALLSSACGTVSTSNTPVPAPSIAPTNYDSSANVLNIVGGSEQESVFSGIVKPWCDSHGISCSFKKLGSVDQAQLLRTGKAPYDAFWFASSVFRRLGDPTGRALLDTEPMFLTPIVFAGWKSNMAKLGFVGKNVSIEQILGAVETKQTSTWVTNPTQSNSGATVLLGFLNYFAHNGPGVPLSAGQLSSVDVQSGITRFVRAFDTTPPSTGTLMSDCVTHQDKCQTMFTYEDLVIEKNKELVAQGKEPLYAVYPQGSLAISDAPLGYFQHGSNPEKEKNFKALQAYLLSDSTQQALLSYGRRPISSIGLSLANAPKDVFNPDWGIQANLHEQSITYPNLDVIQSALTNYQSSYRKPVDAVYCLDGSGSMNDNGGWQGVKDSADLLFNPDLAKQYLLQINPLDTTSVLIFDDGIKADLATVKGNDPKQLLGLDTAIKSYSAGSGTGIYRCLATALKKFDGLPTEGRKRLIILMTDGQDGDGGSEILGSIKAQGIPVIAIGFGADADVNALSDIATKTGGTYIKAGDDLPTALRQATGYK